MTIAIFGNTFKDDTVNVVTHILEFMKAHDVKVLLSRELRDVLSLRDQYGPFTEETTEVVDFALSVGGDGTFLNTAAQVAGCNIPILGINLGRLGFLADVRTTDVYAVCEQLVNNDYTIEQRAQLEVKASKGGYITYPFALNEVAVMKQGLSSMIEVETWVNGEHLHTYEADGLLVCTPTGSTAYNLSVGGPLLEPNTKAIILAPIATHSLNVRPLVVPDDWKIDLKIKSRNQEYLISVDGRSQTMREDMTLHIEKACKTIKLVQLGKNSFLQSLKDKLNWGK